MELRGHKKLSTTESYVLVGVLAAGACAPYTVVQRTEPSALLGARRVVVDSDWSQVDIAGAGQPAVYAEIQARTEAAIVKVLQRRIGDAYAVVAGGAAGPGDLRLVVRPVAVKLAVVVQQAGPMKLVHLDARLEWMRGDEVTDVIDAHTTVGSQWPVGASPWRLDAYVMSLAGRNVGAAAARYFTRAQAQ